MFRIGIIITVLLTLVLCSPATAAEGQLTAQQVFDKMIHYEYDQLSKVPSITDYRCDLTETTVRPGNPQREVVDKILYFMVPMFQLQMVGDEPVFYFDQDLMLILLDSVELARDRDQTVNEIPCYSITTRPSNPAYRAYSRTYLIAKDDFRHVRTISHHASEQIDNLTTQIDYTYGDVGGETGDFKLLVKTVAETKDADNNLIATVTAEYKDYQFGVGLDVQFFTDRVGNRSPNLPQS
jgi:hypothetical protein